MLGILLLMIGNGLQGTLLGIRGTLEEIDVVWMGLIMSAYFVGFLGGSRVTPYLLRRVGHIRVFAALGSLVSAAFILYAAIIEPWFWLTLRLIVGFCFSGLYVVAESWINEMASNENRGQTLSLYIIIQMLGLVLGQSLLNVGDPTGYALFILISVLVSISFAPILLSVAPTPVFNVARPMALRELLNTSPLGCVGIFLLGGIFSGLHVMSAIYGMQQGLSVPEISWFVVAIYIGGVLMQYPVGWISDRMDRRTLMVAMTALGSIVAVGGMLGQSLWWLLCIAFFLGASLNPLYALMLAHTNDHLASEQMSSASGGLMFIHGIGAMGGPMVIGLLIERLGPNGFFLFIATLSVLICLYGLYRMSRREAVAIEDTQSYIPVTATSSPVAVEMATEAAIADEA